MRHATAMVRQDGARRVEMRPAAAKVHRAMRSALGGPQRRRSMTEEVRMTRPPMFFVIGGI